jgi:hypothetical protein
VHVFDDGWGVGQNVDTGRRGVFPMVCLEGELGAGREGKRESSVSRRVSSLVGVSQTDSLLVENV